MLNSVFSIKISFQIIWLTKAVRAMLTAALAAIASFFVVKGGKDHEAFFVHVEIFFGQAITDLTFGRGLDAVAQFVEGFANFTTKPAFHLFCCACSSAGCNKLRLY